MVIQKQFDFLFYALIFSVIFLIANYIIEISVSISQSVHVYRTAAIYDGLTGVYNKESFDFFLDFMASLDGKTHKELSISVIDIDNFKEINDNYGHPVGDEALKYFSKYMKKNSTPLRQYICRIGGDEFAIIHNQSPGDSEAFFTKFLHDLATNPFHLNDTEIPLSLSIGMTHFRVSSDFNTQKALEAADAALYHAKKNGKNKIYITTHAE